MKKIKKLMAMLLALTMVLGMSVTVFAEQTNPSDDDTALAKVLNVEQGATVTAYRIVVPTYTDNGVTGYEVAKDSSKQEIEGLIIADPKAPTAAEITAIAANETVLGKLTSVTNTNDGNVANGFVPSEVKTTGKANEIGKVDFSAKLKAGYWLVIVKGTKDVYNPMLLGVYYSKSGSDNTLNGDDDDQDNDAIVDSNSNWTLIGGNAYVKSTKPTLEKTIVNADGKTDTNSSVPNGGDVAIGDIVGFKIETVIPSYSSEYKADGLVVEINDELSKGLTLT